MNSALATARALADPNRLRTVAVLMEQDELCVCQITALLGLATPTVSRHMAILHDAGLLRSRKSGRWVYYRLSDSLSPALAQWLEDSFSASGEAENDRAAVRRILECDPRTLCACCATDTPASPAAAGDPAAANHP